MSETKKEVKNVYEKLQECRVLLQNAGLHKSGKKVVDKKTGATIRYFELKDFLPEINRLCKEHKLFTLTSFDKDYATLQIVNAENPEEKIIFSSPMADAILYNASPIQCIGAAETYQRRYLLMVAFEIVESDELDATIEDNEQSTQSYHSQSSYVPSDRGKHGLSQKQIGRLYAIAKSKGRDKDRVDATVKSKYKVDPIDMTKEQYEEVVDAYEKIEG